MKILHSYIKKWLKFSNLIPTDRQTDQPTNQPPAPSEATSSIHDHVMKLKYHNVIKKNTSWGGEFREGFDHFLILNMDNVIRIILMGCFSSHGDSRGIRSRFGLFAKTDLIDSIISINTIQKKILNFSRKT